MAINSIGSGGGNAYALPGQNQEKEAHTEAEYIKIQAEKKAKKLSQIENKLKQAKTEEDKQSIKNESSYDRLKSDIENLARKYQRMMQEEQGNSGSSNSWLG